jgi:hypothetical protein
MSELKIVYKQAKKIDAEEVCERVDVIKHELPPSGVVNPCKEGRW